MSLTQITEGDIQSFYDGDSSGIVASFEELTDRLERKFEDEAWFDRFNWEANYKSPYIGPEDAEESSYVWVGFVDEEYDMLSKQSKALQFEFGINAGDGPAFFNREVKCGIFLGRWTEDVVLEDLKENLYEHSDKIASFLADNEEYVFVTAEGETRAPSQEEIRNLSSDIDTGFDITLDLELEKLPDTDLLELVAKALRDLSPLYWLLAGVENPPVKINEKFVEDKDLSDYSDRVQRLGGATSLNVTQVQSNVDNLTERGCSESKALRYVEWYLRDMLQEEGLFALRGVGPVSGRELVAAGISCVEDVNSTAAEALQNRTDLSEHQITSIKSAAENGEFGSLQPDNEDVAEELLESFTPPYETPEGYPIEGPTKNQAKSLLKQSLGSDATFRTQQLEAIEKLVDDRERILLVQRTGWGKSTVYFIATHLLRQRGEGPTLIISPLLALMRNQIKDAEEELGLKALTIHSGNKEDWDAIIKQILNDECDLLLISPERLINAEFRRNVLEEMSDGFGMLVVDEAHCISEWGHDFRPDYRRIKRIIKQLPKGTPVAATTATANDRVVEDVTAQLPDLTPVRGQLVRESLQLQTIELGDRPNRLAWLAENFPETPPSGIVYCLTIDDVESVSEWLTIQGYDVRPYHGRLDDDKRTEREQLLLENEVDALVATNALGMGFNKPDLGFVIHFQRPPNLIEYYQEIGRAGRDLDEAYAIILSGADDDDIAEYFIESSFPDPADFNAVLETIEESTEPISERGISKQLDISWRDIETCLNMLHVDRCIAKEEGGYVRTAISWEYDSERVEKVTNQRYNELEQIKSFINTDQCLTRFVDDALDGKLDEDCGHCASCVGPYLPETINDRSLVEQAKDHYKRRNWGTIKPRKRAYTSNGERTSISTENCLSPGRYLSVWDDNGWGQLVHEGKYVTGEFDNRLVTASKELISDQWEPSPRPEWVTAVPSESTEGLIVDFAEQLAEQLGIPFANSIEITGDKQPQKEMNNSYHKCQNVREIFTVSETVHSGPVLLIDDVVGSRWTLTEAGRALGEAGVETVYPFALAKRRG